MVAWRPVVIQEDPQILIGGCQPQLYPPVIFSLFFPSPEGPPEEVLIHTGGHPSLLIHDSPVKDDYTLIGGSALYSVNLFPTSLSVLH